MIHGGSKNTDVVVDIKVRVDTIDLGLHHTCGSCFISPTKKQEAQLSQRDRATRLSLNISRSHSRSFKMILLS